MQAINAQVAALLAKSVRAPRVYCSIQLPAISNTQLSTIDALKIGSQLWLDDILACTMTQTLDIGSDTADIRVSNQDGSRSPFSLTNAYARYFQPGDLDNKYQIFLGLADGANVETIFSKGTYVSKTIGQDSKDGSNELTINMRDQFALGKGQVYLRLPPLLYGKQNGPDFRPNLALSNPSGDLKTYVADARNWMTGIVAGDQSTAYLPIAVYSSAVSAGGSPVPNSGATAYSTDAVNGTVTFTTAQGPTDVISVDATPQAMSPELAIKHLYWDYAALAPSSMRLDNSGILMPVLELARDRSINDIAKDIVATTNVKGANWQLFFDENGYLTFTEGNLNCPPVATLTDEFDILSVKPEFSSDAIANVVRINAQAFNNQAITIVSYDIWSISKYGQQATYDVPNQFTSTMRGMDSGSALIFANMLANSILFSVSTPSIIMELQVMPNPAYQVGDPLTVIENKTGLNKDFYITQIQNDVTEDWKQILRVTQLKHTQDFQFGIQANIGAPQANNQNQISAQNGLITSVTMANSGDSSATYLVNSGQPVTDATGLPVEFNWNGSPLTITTQFSNVVGAHVYCWRWMYLAEDSYVTPGGVMTGDGRAAGVWANWLGYTTSNYGTFTGDFTCYPGPYDVVNNIDSIRSRRFWWPMMRCSDWVTNDGSLDVNNTTQTSTWSVGPVVTNPRVYGNLRVGQSNYFQNVSSSGFSGQAIFGAGTPASTALGGASSTVLYGTDFGPSFTGTSFYGLRRKTTPAYFGCFVATTAGSCQYKSIRFNLTV